MLSTLVFVFSLLDFRASVGGRSRVVEEGLSAGVLQTRAIAFFFFATHSPPLFPLLRLSDDFAF